MGWSLMLNHENFSLNHDVESWELLIVFPFYNEMRLPKLFITEFPSIMFNDIETIHDDFYCHDFYCLVKSKRIQTPRSLFRDFWTDNTFLTRLSEFRVLIEHNLEPLLHWPSSKFKQKKIQCFVNFWQWQVTEWRWPQYVSELFFFKKFLFKTWQKQFLCSQINHKWTAVFESHV